MFEKTHRLLADLGAGHLDATWERRLRRYLAPDLLILDFGLRAFSERQGEICTSSSASAFAGARPS